MQKVTIPRNPIFKEVIGNETKSRSMLQLENIKRSKKTGETEIIDIESINTVDHMGRMLNIKISAIIDDSYHDRINDPYKCMTRERR